ncbi:hypothetical protein [Methanobacterium spitsbergense]|uniref:Uncharacterized protein n=1 Tax=Methanobacterium spitsbergense TaxID=2874285 RepID=A0A8T5UQU7_9EURY|nr:hypothetical protein [Methanobacterium spitsbergense]MBZ2164507.1 hypothetical protein [Methanobacterium spitsbergense]
MKLSILAAILVIMIINIVPAFANDISDIQKHSESIKNDAQNLNKYKMNKLSVIEKIKLTIKFVKIMKEIKQINKEAEKLDVNNNQLKNINEQEENLNIPVNNINEIQNSSTKKKSAYKPDKANIDANKTIGELKSINNITVTKENYNKTGNLSNELQNGDIVQYINSNGYIRYFVFKGLTNDSKHVILKADKKEIQLDIDSFISDDQNKQIKLVNMDNKANPDFIINRIYQNKYNELVSDYIPLNHKKEVMEILAIISGILAAILAVLSPFYAASIIVVVIGIIIIVVLIVLSVTMFGLEKFYNKKLDKIEKEMKDLNKYR